MKKIYLIATVLFSLALSLTSCSKDDAESSNYNIVANAGEAVAKSYTGTWTRTLGDEVVTSQGTITLAGTDQAHVAIIRIILLLNTTFGYCYLIAIPIEHLKT